MAFDLSSVLRDVSNLDTPEEQITRLPLDLLDPDPDNFYSLDGLDELAGNIETVGLLDPIRVRPAGDRYIVVSGHRRRAACMLIRDGGSQQFKDGVPCIIELGECSDALRRLRLIYANSSTRQLSAAELSRQAEEVTRILYELKEQGMEFSGRMRDHVAEACRLSKTKIGRLHAIRANLIPELLARFDAGEVKEEAAYQLSRYPVEIQHAVAEHMEKPNVKNWPRAGTLEDFLKKLDGYMKPQPCPAKAGAVCSNCEQRVLHNLFNYDWAWCGRKCCLDCAKVGRSCGFMCKAGKDRMKLDKEVDKEVAKEKEAKQKEDAAAREEIEQKALRREAKRLLALAERAGLSDSVAIGEYGKAKVGDLREIVAGKQKANKWDLRAFNLEDAERRATKLNCTIDEVLGRTPPKPETPADLEPAWQTGRPKKAGLYAVRFKVSKTAPGELHNFALWDNFQWKAVRSGKVIADLVAVGWYPLPALDTTEEETE